MGETNWIINVSNQPVKICYVIEGFSITVAHVKMLAIQPMCEFFGDK